MNKIPSENFGWFKGASSDSHGSIMCPWSALKFAELFHVRSHLTVIEDLGSMQCIPHHAG